MPTHSLITATNHSAFISISVYFLLVTFILAVIIRFAIRLGIARALSKDDWVCFVSMLVGIGQSIAVTVGVHHGLGKAESLLSTSQITKILQAQYASSYFYVISLGLSKISILLLVMRLAVERLHKKIALYAVYFTSAWTAAALVTVAVRCGAHPPWTVSASAAVSQCIDTKTFWIAMTPFDVLIEMVIVTTPILMMIPVQVAVSKKMVIIFAFLFRIMVIVSSITRLFFLLPHVPSTNFTFRMVNAEILTQVVLSISITTACIPCLKPFLDAFDSGQMAVSFKNGLPGTHSGGNSYQMRDLAYANSLAYGAKGSGGGGGVRSRIEASADDEDDSIEAAKYGSNRSKGAATNNNHPHHCDLNARTHEREGSGSVASDSKSDQMIIKKDVQWTVSYEDVDHGARHSQHGPMPPSSAGESRVGRSPSGIRSNNGAQSRRQDDGGDEIGGLGQRHGGGLVGYAV